MIDIEEIAVGVLKKVLGRSQYLKPFIDSNDKTPVWDGNLFVYQDSSGKKSEFSGRIPVQVKGKQVPSLHKDTISYLFEVADLKNYEVDGGVILFVVEISPDEEKTFYKSLWRSDLKEVLNEAKKKKRAKVTIKLEELNPNKLSIFEGVCRSFIFNRTKQYSTSDYQLTIKDAKELRIYFIPDGTPIEDYLLSHDVPLYGRKNEGEIEQFITKINIDTVIKQLNCNVLINDKLYYSNYEIETTKKGSIIKLGKSISINFDTQVLKYNFTGTLEEQILDISFLLDMFESENFLLGDRKFEIPIIKDKKPLVEQLANSLKEFKEIQSLLSLFKVTTKALDISSLDKTSYVNLHILIGKFLYNKTFERVPFSPGFNAIRIGNICLGIFVYKTENDKGFAIMDLFDLTNKIQFRTRFEDNTEFILVSPYVFLEKGFLLIIDNLNLEIIFEDIKRIPHSKEYHEIVTLFGLELIKAYDDSNREVFLSTACNIFTWLEEEDENDFISKINTFQIIKRQRNLTKDEKLILFQMRDKFLDNNMGLCSLSILLENRFDAEYYYNRLDGETQKQFNEFPIYSLFKKLDIS